MTHPFRAWPLIVLAVFAACQAPVTPTTLRTTGPTTTASAGQPTSSDQPTSSLPPIPTPSPSPTPVVTISQQTDEATVTIEIPAPLIPAGVSVAVEDHPLQDAPREVRDAGVRQAFHVLTPQDLTFDQPVRVTVTMPRSAFTRPDGKLALALPAVRSAEGDWQWLANPEVTVTADTVEMTGLTAHLGSLFLWSDLTDLDGVGSSLSAQPLNQPFRLLLNLRPQLARPNPVAIVGTPAFAVDNGNVLQLGGPVGGPLDRNVTCLQPGGYTVTLNADLENFGADVPFLTGTLGLPPTDLTLNYLIAGDCVRPAPTPTPPTASPTPSANPSASVNPSPSASAPSGSHPPSFSPPPKSSPSSSP